MSQFANVMEVFNLLDKNNCRECGEKTCMSFAASVFMGAKQLWQCPTISQETIAGYGVQEKRQHGAEDDFNQRVARLKTGLRSMDLAARAESIGADYEQDKISLKIMGKRLSIDIDGNVSTDIHVNPWVLVSALSYINYCKGIPPTSDWVPLRELPSGQDWYRLFGEQCEKVLKKTADGYPDLFADVVDIFSGKQIANQFQSDIAVILSPLPLVPMLICYWKPEEGMDSALNLFFDATAEGNIGIDGLYTLGTGIAKMFEQMALQHGVAVG